MTRNARASGTIPWERLDIHITQGNERNCARTDGKPLGEVARLYKDEKWTKGMDTVEDKSL